MPEEVCHLFYRIPGVLGDSRSEFSCCGRVHRDDHPVCKEIATASEGRYKPGSDHCPFCGRTVCKECIEA